MVWIGAGRDPVRSLVSARIIDFISSQVMKATSSSHPGDVSTAPPLRYALSLLLQPFIDFLILLHAFVQLLPHFVPLLKPGLLLFELLLNYMLQSL